MGKKQKTKKTGWVYSRNLVRKQQIMQKAMINELVVGVLFLFALILVLIVAMPNFREAPAVGIAICVLLFGFMVVFIFCAFRRYQILRQLYGITSPAGQEIQITCKKVRFMTMASSKHSSVLICTVFHSDEGQKYYHIHNDCPLWDRRKKARFRQYQGQECALICYKDTAIIKEIADSIVS